MARKNIGTSWNRGMRNNLNSNFVELYRKTDEFEEGVSEDVFNRLLSSAEISWGEPVDSFADLPTQFVEGNTRMVRDTGKVYRNNGSEWLEIQQVDVGPINEVDRRLSEQVMGLVKKQTLNIEDFPRSNQETTDDGRFERALAALGEGVLQLNAEMYTVKDEIVIDEYQLINGVYGSTTVYREDGGRNANNVFKVSDGEWSKFWVGFTNLVVSYYGSNPNMSAFNLNKSSQLKMQDIKIKGYFRKAVIGEEVWLADLSNITAWCDNNFGHTAYDIISGTSLAMSNVWSKNFARGFNLNEVLYSSLTACACDTFSVYAYSGGQGVVYTGCGAEDGKLIKGGYVWGNTYRSVNLSGCQVMYIDAAPGVNKGETSLFMANGSSMSIDNFRQQNPFDTSDMIDVVHGLSDCKVSIQNSQIHKGYHEKVYMDDEYGEVVIGEGYSKTIYSIDKSEEVSTSAYREFTGGFRKVGRSSVADDSYNKRTESFLAQKVTHKNSFQLTTYGKADKLPLLASKKDIAGTYTVTAVLDVVVSNYSGYAGDVGTSVLKVVIRDVNGSKGTPEVTTIGGSEHHGISVAWEGNNLSLRLSSIYAKCFIDATVFQSISSGQAKLRWL